MLFNILLGGIAAGAGVAGEMAAAESQPLSEAFHYAVTKDVPSIMSTGLRANTYATTNGTLSPWQAHLDLALDPALGPRDSLLRIDLDALRGAGYEIPDVTPVGRSWNMPGGGDQMQFPYLIPPKYIIEVRVPW